MTKTVIILSWWMDSTTLLYKLINQWKEIHAISFDYWQKHKKELEYAKATCDKIWCSHSIVDLSNITKLISNSSLTSDQEVPEWHYAEENMKQTVVPNRNMIMASIAIGYAVNIWANEVALWVHAGDHAIYPDCRPEFIELLNQIWHIANFDPIKIYAPYVEWVDKWDIVIEWLWYWVDYALTWTCYKWEWSPCWKCGSCMERLLAFKKAIDNWYDNIWDTSYLTKELFWRYLQQAVDLDNNYNN